VSQPWRNSFLVMEPSPSRSNRENALRRLKFYT
jgi:hypothetical protein